MWRRTTHFFDLLFSFVSKGLSGFVAAVFLCSAPVLVRASTAITFTRAEVTQMAGLWETDPLAISSLANGQYPTYTTGWQFIFPHTSISGDGDVHSDMAVNSSGSGSSGNNTGASPIVCEIINATQTNLSHVDSLSGRQAIFRGIFRFYTEHSSERHFELHPVVGLDLWNGSTFVIDSDYHPNITAVADATTHTSSTLANAINGSQTMTAIVQNDGVHINFTFPSPSVNYVYYDGIALSTINSDAVSSYFLFRPNSVPTVTLRCRLIANSAAANAAAGLTINQAVTVNALTRTDMSQVDAQVATMTVGESRTFGRPIELIVLGLPSIGPSPTPTPTPTPTPSATPTPTATPGGNTFSNTASLPMSGAANSQGKGSPYPSTLNVSGMPGVITNVTARLDNITHDFPGDLDILLVSPAGQNVMLVSDAGSTHSITNIDVTLDDSATSSLSFRRINSGTYRPTNLTPSGDADAFPSPAPAKPYGSALSGLNGASPNGTWNLFVLDEYTSGSGSIGGGWTITITTQPAAPLVATTAATAVTSNTATLNGTINPLGLASTSAFNFGTSISYTDSQPAQNAGSGTTAASASLLLTGLKPGTTYHYQLTGQNSVGPRNGADMTFTTATFADSDGDGIPNDYETANGLDPNNAADAALDRDGDGLTNLQEYLAGTNPNSAASVVRITDMQKMGDDFAVTFPTVLGKRYQVQQCSDLLNPVWITLEDNIKGTGQPVTSIDFAAADAATTRYYRVLVLP